MAVRRYSLDILALYDRSRSRSALQFAAVYDR